MALENISGVDEAYKPLLRYLPYIILSLAMGLAYQFNRVRSFAAGTTLTMTYFALQAFLQQPLSEPPAHFIYSAASLLVPLNLLLSLVMPEKGLRHISGFLLLTLVPLEACILWAWYAQDAAEATTLVTALPVKPYPGYILSTTASIWFAIATLVSLVWITWRRPDASASLFFALVSVYIVLAWLQKPYISVVIFSAAAAMLIADLLRNTYNMAYRDDLTGILGRRALNEKLRSLGRRYVVAMLDIDHFKKFNDTHGHDVGDEVLKLVAKQISQVTGGGQAFRYGGEEFTILFPGAAIETCKPHLEAVRESIANYPLVLRNRKRRPKSGKQGSAQRGKKAKHKSVSITVSIGVSQRGEALKTPGQVIKSADTALYKAKQMGRNCVV